MSDRKEMSSEQQEFFEQLKAGNWELPAGLKELGIKPHLWLKDVSYGQVTYEWPNDGSRNIGPGRVFGGWIAALSDHIVSMTMSTALQGDEWFTTTELTTRMFRPMMEGPIRVEGRLISRGRTTGYVEANYYDDKDRLIARANAAKAIRSMEELQAR